MKSARACLTPFKKPHVRIPLTAEHPAPPALRDLTGPDRTVDRRTARRAQRLAALRGLLAGAAAPADKGRRRPRCAARPWGARPLRPPPPGSERPRLPAGPARLLTCSPPAGGPSARRALRPPVPGRCHLRPWKRRAGRSGVTQRGRPASRLPPRLPPRAAGGATLGPRAHLPASVPCSRPLAARPALPAPRRQRGRSSEDLCPGKLRHLGGADPGVRSSRGLQSCVQLRLIASSSLPLLLPHLHTPLQPRKKSKFHLERRPTQFLSVVLSCMLPRSCFIYHGSQHLAFVFVCLIFF